VVSARGDSAAMLNTRKRKINGLHFAPGTVLTECASSMSEDLLAKAKLPINRLLPANKVSEDLLPNNSQVNNTYSTIHKPSLSSQFYP
jgi:hypothetical protein